MRQSVQKYETLEACNKRQRTLKNAVSDAKEEYKEIELRKQQIKTNGENQLTILDKWKVNK